METQNQPEVPVINPDVAKQEDLYGIISDPRFSRIHEQISLEIARLSKDIEALRKLDFTLDASLAIAGKEHRIDQLNRLTRFFKSIIEKQNTPQER